MKKKKLLLNALFVFAAVGYAPSLLAQNTGAYVGLGLIQSKMTVEDLTVDNLPLPDIFTAPPNPSSTSSPSSTSNSWTIFGGYQFTRFFAVEALYVPLGEHTRDMTASARIDPRKRQPTGLNVSGFGTFTTVDKLNIDGFGLTALGKVPLTDRIALFAKYGIFRWSGKLYRETAFYPRFRAIPPTYAYTDKDSGYSPILGFGASYRLVHRASIRAEWVKISSLGGKLSTGKSDATYFSLGAQLNF